MKFVEVGLITKPHGVRGEVKVRLHWEGSDALSRVSDVTVKMGDRERRYVLESVRGASKGGAVVRLAGVHSRDEAEALRGAAVSVARDALPELEPGEYYLCDLVGARVVGPDGWIGDVVEIAVHPSVDCLVIRTAAGELREQPIDEAWVSRVDVAERLVELSNTDGLV